MMTAVKISYANYFAELENIMKKEEARRAKEVLESDLLGGYDSPKEIEITCPTVSQEIAIIYHCN